LDTSVLFAAVLSRSGGARKIFHLGEAGVLQLIVGPAILKEADEVVRRKIPASLPELAKILNHAHVETSRASTRRQLEIARTCVHYPPDASVLAEAIQAKPDWFVTHDKTHFLQLDCETSLGFKVGTPGDLLQRIKNDITAP
jgi:predicted nucleic acid-binding protein